MDIEKAADLAVEAYTNLLLDQLDKPVNPRQWEDVCEGNLDDFRAWFLEAMSEQPDDFFRKLQVAAQDSDSAKLGGTIYRTFFNYVSAE